MKRRIAVWLDDETDALVKRIARKRQMKLAELLEEMFWQGLRVGIDGFLDEEEQEAAAKQRRRRLHAR